MKETFVITSQTIDLARTLAYQNKSIFNVRFLNCTKLASEALMRSGKTCNKQFISSSEELAIYFDVISNVDYFKTIKLEDVKRINSSINTLRKLVINNEEVELKKNLLKGAFINKNKALLQVYEEYNKKINSENKIDSIGLLRYALSNSNPINSEFVIIKEYPLQPLELELVKALSNNNYKEKSLFELFCINQDRTHIASYENCYGTSNEVAHILDEILKNKKIDQSIVACADYRNYAQTFFDYACKYNIPMNFSDGLAIINSYPGKLLEQYYHWQGQGNFGWQPFFDLIHNPYFNYELLLSNLKINEEKEYNLPLFWQRVSKLRLTNNPSINAQRIENFKKSIARDINNNHELLKYVDNMEIIGKELSLPIEEFINKYAITRNDNELLIQLDNGAKSSICNELKTLKNIGLEITDDIIESLLRKNVAKNSPQPGRLYISSINKAISSMRNNLYVCGLSSTIYPGSIKENPLILDSDFECFNNDSLTSTGLIKQKKEALFTLICLASSLNNSIHLSYSGLNVSELKNNNASSLLFEIYKQENGSNKQLSDLESIIKKIDYFEPNLSVSSIIGNAYNNDYEIEYKQEDNGTNKITPLSLREYSPSALNIFFKCKKQFLYQYLLRIPAPDDYLPYEVISASEQGTLVHSLMEYLTDHPMSKEEFTKLGGECFDEWMNISVPLIQENISNVKEQFLEMLENGWQMDHAFPRKVLSKEVDQHTTHKESGVNIHGFPDRVELTQDGKAVIIDFKTERKLDNHIQDDIDSCLQVLIYAYIVEHTTGIQVDHCEFRMLRFADGIVTCKYDEQMKQQLTDKLIEFKSTLDNFDFDLEPILESEEVEKCKFCKYASICGKEIVADEQDS